MSSKSEPVVTLKHGGQRRGKAITFNGQQVNLFLGVRYAQPPVGKLRFSKPQPHPGWTGVVDAITPGRIASQMVNVHVGDEDCLYLDITVPGGTQSLTKRPVMLWIHGGSYRTGSGSHYIGAPLALHGDVIIVTINYRLGMLGFLSERPGTGNFGLWDQREAIVWVKQNIDRFGGDPDLITIFGESAGAASVSAQMMCPHNKDLFRRAIQQSGSLFDEWSWFKSPEQCMLLTQRVRKAAKCGDSVGLYECLKDKTLSELTEIRREVEAMYDNSHVNLWHPVPDDDFFAADIVKEDYNFPFKVDLLAGYNGQEGLLMLSKLLRDDNHQHISKNGMTKPEAREEVRRLCEVFTPNSVDSSFDFMMDSYGIDSVEDDKNRTLKVIEMYGEVSIAADTVRQLVSHSISGDHCVTYGYHFTEPYRATDNYSFWSVPDWSKNNADHSDDLIFVFGGIYCKENYKAIIKDYYGDKIPEGENTLDVINLGPSETDRTLTNTMMSIWTSFAQSGNPMRPTLDAITAPEWPPFVDSSALLMELSSKHIRVIPTPNRHRLKQILTI